MPLNIEVTQFPNGIGTVADNNILNGVPGPLPNNGAIIVEDFTGGENYADHWTNVTVGAPAVAAILASSNGVVRFTTPGAPRSSWSSILDDSTH
jgi:hypothetical protein